MIKKIRAHLSEHPRLRVLVIIIGFIIAIIVGMRIFSSRTVTQQTQLPASNIQPSDNGAQQKAPKVSQSRYKNLSNANKQSTLKTAASSGQSYFSNVFNDAKTVKPKTSAKQQDSLETSKPKIHAVNPINFYRQQHGGTTPKGTLRMDHASNSDNGAYGSGQYMTPEQRQYQLERAMQKQLQGETKNWHMPTQKMVVGALPAASSSNGAGGESGQGPVMIKAGSILFAVLDTALNSDQPGTPVLATVVTGKYRGARLMGNFRREHDKLVVAFNMMSVKGMPRSVSINAYAINAKTAQNALATSVNHHYLLRYGSLFAAAFLQGFGNAFQTVQPTCPPGSPCTIIGTGDQIKTTTTQAAYQGLGRVGTNLSNVVEQEFNRPPTVKLKQGVGLGILFMSDVTANGTAPTAQQATSFGQTAAATAGGMTKANKGALFGGSTNITANQQ